MRTGLFEKKHFPYYIVAPSYDHRSGGNKIMHYLCHALNLAGEDAKMITGVVNPDLRTPIAEIINGYLNDYNSIVIYPETNKKREWDTAVAIKYLLSSRYSENELDEFDLSVGFIEEFYPADYKREKLTIRLPMNEPRVFYKDDKIKKDIESCYYVGRNEGIKLHELTKNSIKITQEYPDTPEKVADLLRRSKIFYCYVGSGLADEAILCGTPTVFIPNEKMNLRDKSSELGEEGLVWGLDNLEKDLIKARATIDQGIEKRLKFEDLFWQRLEKFISSTQEICAKKEDKTRL